MKIGLIGSSGRVGKLLVNRKGVVPLECDITNSQSIEDAVNRVRPDVIASLASKSDVDWCEQDENVSELFRVNVLGVNNLGMIAQKHYIPSVIISTDHIFSGRSFFDWKLKAWVSKGPYKENYSRPLPVNQYGISKLSAEMIASTFDSMSIVRTSYLFDRERITKSNWRAPTFIYRSFMHVEHFVEAFYWYLTNIHNPPKVLHISGSKTVSWYEFLHTYGGDSIFPRTKPMKGYTPRPFKAGLDVSLSPKLGVPQFDYLDGLKLL